MMGKMCESCGMPIKKDVKKGTNSDGSLSKHYCHLCYKDGAFCVPDATPEQMQEYSVKGMVEGGWPKFLATFLTKNIPKLPRWQQEDTSKPVQ